MASDVYMQIDGIKGESKDSNHQGWIEVSSVHWGIHQPRSATASTSGGHTAERVEMKEVSFEKMADLSSPILMQTCAMGKTIPKVTFEFMRADGAGTPICYFRMELRNVLIGGVEPGIEPGNLLGEHVSLKYAQMVWKYTQQQIAGGSGGSTVGGWDCAANKVAT